MLEKMRILTLALSLSAVASSAMALNAVPDDPLDREVAPGITKRDYIEMRQQIEMEYRANQEALKSGKSPKRILSPYSKDTATGLSTEELAEHKARQNEALRQYVMQEFLAEVAKKEAQEHKAMQAKKEAQKASQPMAGKPQGKIEHVEVEPGVFIPADHVQQYHDQKEMARLIELEQGVKKEPEVYLISDKAKEQNKAHTVEHVAIEEVQVFIDKENIKLSEAIEQIVAKTKPHAGHWDIKWRLSRDNREIKNQLVNLTAEATFSEFMDYLLERIQNMTGVKLFVKKFETSRVIVISDVY